MSKNMGKSKKKGRGGGPKKGGAENVFVGSVLIQVFGGNLALYGMITAIILTQTYYQVRGWGRGESVSMMMSSYISDLYALPNVSTRSSCSWLIIRLQSNNNYFQLSLLFHNAHRSARMVK